MVIRRARRVLSEAWWRIKNIRHKIGGTTISPYDRYMGVPLPERKESPSGLRRFLGGKPAKKRKPSRIERKRAESYAENVTKVRSIEKAGAPWMDAAAKRVHGDRVIRLLNNRITLHRLEGGKEIHEANITADKANNRFILEVHPNAPRGIPQVGHFGSREVKPGERHVVPSPEKISSITFNPKHSQFNLSVGSKFKYLGFDEVAPKA